MTDSPEKIAVREAFHELIQSGQQFTADHVHATVEPEVAAWMDEHRNVIGGFFSSASARGRITHCGPTKPSRKLRKGNHNGIWKGVPA